MDELSMVVGAVLSQTAGVGFKVAGTPIEARRQLWEENTKARLLRTRAAADHQSHRRPLTPSVRVAFKALDEAATNDDALVADYLGGVIAASGPNDDAGVPMVALIARLSSRQLLFRYLAYRALRSAAEDDTLPHQVSRFHDLGSQIPALAVGVTHETMAALGAANPVPDPPAITSLTRSLISEDLLGPDVHTDAVTDLAPSDVATITFTPTVLGAELFLWGHGITPVSAYADEIFNPLLSFDVLSELPPLFKVRDVIPATDPIEAFSEGLDKRIIKTVTDDLRQQEVLRGGLVG